MDKDEMVKDLTKTMCEFETPCTECEFNTNAYRCSYKAYAEQVYNAGYRKVGEDEIVESMKTYERARQETAREILQTILDESGIDMLGNCYRLPTRVFNKIKYKYGIELED